MEQIAKMLGVDLHESFRFKSNEIDLSKYEYRLTEKQLEYYCEEFNVWYAATFKTICNLLNGEYEVVKLPKSVLSETEKECAEYKVFETPEHPLSVLTEKEKKRLSYVIEPFKDEIKHIYKYSCEKGDFEAIVAMCTNGNHHVSFNFPAFEKNTMYKGMEIGKKYTLKELDL